MKLSWSFVAPLLCSAVSARDASVYIYDRLSTSSDVSSEVDLETARLILAQRLGLSQFHSLTDRIKDSQVQQINTFGGRQQKLFGAADTDKSQAQVLLWVEDVEDARELVTEPSKWSSAFTIPNPPPTSDNDRLLQDLALQAESLPKKADPKGHTHESSNSIDSIMSQLQQCSLPKVSSDYLTIVRVDKSCKLPVKQLAASIKSLRDYAAHDYAATHSKDITFSIVVVLMPPSSSHSKRTAQPYGTYDLPSKLGPRRELPEAPLSLSSSQPSTSPNTKVPDLEDFPVITQAENNNTAPLGILQSCYSSESACVKATNNCTGHGECKLLHKGGQGRAGCYGCACKPTVIIVDDKGMETHKKTTYWGGPACQKKDVSVPFWLLVGTGVLLAFLISSGIGLLYSMGSEELPSVIGAGVSGPVRK